MELHGGETQLDSAMFHTVILFRIPAARDAETAPEVDTPPPHNLFVLCNSKGGYEFICASPQIFAQQQQGVGTACVAPNSQVSTVYEGIVCRWTV